MCVEDMVAGDGGGGGLPVGTVGRMSQPLHTQPLIVPVAHSKQAPQSDTIKWRKYGTKVKPHLVMTKKNLISYLI
jgi:hypothetical protein